MTSKSQRVWRAAALTSVRFYQVAWRPLNPWACKFYPSCSDYAVEAIERYGVWRGIRLALGRLLRCRPGVFGGYDPVAESIGKGILSGRVAPGNRTLDPKEQAVG